MTGEPGGHSEVIYDDGRIPSRTSSATTPVGQGFVLAQKRLGPGASTTPCAGSGTRARVRHDVRARVSRYSHGSLLAEKQMVQDWVATSTPRCGPPAC